MEQESTLKALRTAIQMEIDGKDYYLQISRSSTSSLGRELLAALAAEEEVHRRQFEEIYRSIEVKKSWQSAGFKPDGGKKLRTIFARAAQNTGARAPASELDAVSTAMDMENRSYDFYMAQSRAAGYAAEKEYYEILAGEEKEHHLVLLDYYEYLKDPAGWFVIKERQSLDGG